MNTRILSLLLAIVLILSSFVGCGSNPDGNELGTTDSPTTDAPTSDEPTSDIPSSDVPTSDAPTSDVPTSDAPTSDAPTSDMPASSSDDPIPPADGPDPVIVHTINAQNIGEYRIVCSSTSNTEEFLSVVNPQYAVICASIDNSYGHPHGVVVERLQNIGATVLMTATDGEVVLECNKSAIWHLKT